MQEVKKVKENTKCFVYVREKKSWNIELNETKSHFFFNWKSLETLNQKKHIVLHRIIIL